MDPLIIPLGEGMAPLVINREGSLQDILGELQPQIEEALNKRAEGVRNWNNGLIGIARESLHLGLPRHVVVAEVLMAAYQGMTAYQLAEALAVLVVDAAVETEAQP